MKRRSFNKLLAAAGVTTSFRSGWTAPLFKQQSAPTLPEVVMNENSVEICINSRYSFHGGYNSTANNQVLANTLWAAASAPKMASERIIYVALPDNLYTYKFQNNRHVLEVHATGDKRKETAAAFELGIATNPAGATEDAGVALHWAHLASVAFWKTTGNQPACCPKDSSRSNANSNWSPVSTVHCVNCYGQMSSVTGLVKTVTAVSSDRSLPDPSTDGTVALEAAMKNPIYGTGFTSEDLTKEQLSQILWASYGCTPHKVPGSPSRQAIAVASFGGNYYFPGSIYVISAAGMQRFHIRKSDDTTNTTADHRLVSSATSDCRAALRTALPRLPQTAPVYIVYCGQKIEYQQLLEAGYCGGGALLQATALGLQGHYVAQFTDAERTAVQTACGIPAAHLPMLIFSAGKDATSSGHTSKNSRHGTPALLAAPNPFTYSTAFTFPSAAGSAVALRVFDAAGRTVRTLYDGRSAAVHASVNWDGRDDRGNPVPPGSYTCVLETGAGRSTVLLRKI